MEETVIWADDDRLSSLFIFEFLESRIDRERIEWKGEKRRGENERKKERKKGTVLVTLRPHIRE